MFKVLVDHLTLGCNKGMPIGWVTEDSPDRSQAGGCPILRPTQTTQDTHIPQCVHDTSKFSPRPAYARCKGLHSSFGCEVLGQTEWGRLCSYLSPLMYYAATLFRV